MKYNVNFAPQLWFGEHGRVHDLLGLSVLGGHDRGGVVKNREAG